MEELKNALRSILTRVDPEDPVSTMDQLAERFTRETGLPCPGKEAKNSTAFDTAYYKMLCEKYNDWRRTEWKDFCNEQRRILNESK